MEKFTALYCRVSTERQKETGTSLDGQEEMNRKKARDLGVPDNLIKVYKDAASGEDIDRPDMNRLRDDVSKGIIERVIIVHPDRLSRDLVDRLIVCSEFEKYNAMLLFVDSEYKNTPEGQLFFNMQSSIAQYELSLIRKRTKRGSLKSSNNGKIMGLKVAPYGYDYVKGEGKLVINEKEAEFVRKIFHWYVYDKITMREIGNRLCAQGAIPKTKNTPEWSHSSIQRMLKNETYIGKFYYNRRKVSKVKGEKNKNGNPKKGYEYRDKEEWIEIEVPAIIDAGVYSLAEDQRNKNTRHSGNIKHDYLLRRKMRCSECGNKYASNFTTSYSKQKDENGKPKHMYPSRSYRCTGSTHRKYGENVKKCSAKVIPADYFEERVWKQIVLAVLNNEDEIIENAQSQTAKPNQEIEETYNLLQFKLAKFEEEKKRIVQLFKKAYIDEEEMDRDMKQINSGIKELKSEMGNYEKQMADHKKLNVNVQILRETIRTVKKLIGNDKEVPFKTKRQVLDYLIDEIILTWQDGELKVNCIGLIDSIIVRNSSQFDEQFVTTTPKPCEHEPLVFSLFVETLFEVGKGKEDRFKVIEQEIKIG